MQAYLFTSGLSSDGITPSVLKRRVICGTYHHTKQSKRSLASYYKRAYAYAYGIACGIHGAPRPAVMRFWSSSFKAAMHHFYNANPSPSARYLRTN